MFHNNIASSFLVMLACADLGEGPEGARPPFSGEFYTEMNVQMPFSGSLFLELGSSLFFNFLDPLLVRLLFN